MKSCGFEMLATNWTIFSTLCGPRQICQQARLGPGVTRVQSLAYGPTARRKQSQAFRATGLSISQQKDKRGDRARPEEEESPRGRKREGEPREKGRRAYLAPRERGKESPELTVSLVSMEVKFTESKTDRFKMHSLVDHVVQPSPLSRSKTASSLPKGSSAARSGHSPAPAGPWQPPIICFLSASAELPILDISYQ